MWTYFQMVHKLNSFFQFNIITIIEKQNGCHPFFSMCLSLDVCILCLLFLVYHVHICIVFLSIHHNKHRKGGACLQIIKLPRCPYLEPHFNPKLMYHMLVLKMYQKHTYRIMIFLKGSDNVFKLSQYLNNYFTSPV